MKTYGKWEFVSGWTYRRMVKSKPFGFLRESWQTWTMPRWMWPLAYSDRFLRHLNNEPEPEVKLDDRHTCTSFGAVRCVQGDYRFPTEDLGKEYRRRMQEALGPKECVEIVYTATTAQLRAELKRRTKKR